MPKRTTRLGDIEDTPVSKRRERRECCWPDCARRLITEVPLCSAHLLIAAQLAAKEAPLMRATIEITPTPEPEPEPEREAVMGVVYYVQVGAHVKIGWTSDLDARMRKYPPNSTLLASHPGTRSDEAQMHRRFTADRTHGREWYVPSVSLTHHIQQVIAKHGRPDAVTFGAKPVTIKRTLGPRVPKKWHPPTM